MWITPAAMCHTFRDKMYLQTTTIWSHWLPCFPSSYSIHTDAFKTIYSRHNFIKHISNTTTVRVFSRKFHNNHHGDCRILADGTWIHHMECCYCLTSILERIPRPNYPRHSLRMHLNHLLLDIHQPHTTSTIWRCFIWTFCHCIKCSFYPAVIISRWGLWEWFWHYWPTHSLKENPPHTPHV